MKMKSLRAPSDQPKGNHKHSGSHYEYDGARDYSEEYALIHAQFKAPKANLEPVGLPLGFQPPHLLLETLVLLLEGKKNDGEFEEREKGESGSLP